MSTQDFEQKTRELIDGLKTTCSNKGLGNDGNEFKIITQVFLYKFLNDKFAFEVKKINPTLAKAENWEQAFSSLGHEERDLLTMQLGPNTARLKPEHLIAHLFSRQNAPGFAKLFDDTLRDIAATNNDIFAVKTGEGTKITLFDRISEYLIDESERDSFCRAIINKLVNFSFERIFAEKHDFYAAIFEYLIKDYNTDSGGKYAEYYTPHAVAKIMAAILAPHKNTLTNVSCYDPSAGSGTLLMNLAHAIGEERCVICSQDISQKSSSLLRLNLILNNLVHSIPNIIKGNTILSPSHRDGHALKQFDFIVSNPPFKLDFSEWRDDLDTKENRARFFAGIPNILKKDKDKMAIYLLFLQHIIYSLKPSGKAAVVVPTGFITAQSGIDKAIRQKLVDDKMLAGVVSMPSNIFAATGTNVSILFIDKTNKDSVILIDASKLGTEIKDGKKQRTVLSEAEENQIISTFLNKQAIDDFSVVVSYSDITSKNYSFSAGQYFDVKIEYAHILKEEFEKKMNDYKKNIKSLFADSEELGNEIIKQLNCIKYE
jgi:type I restriction enzyme M protein